MAAIDKTYTDSFKDYQDFKNWVKDKSVTFKYGNKQVTKYVADWVYKWEKEDFDGRELPIMNTPTWIDIYLNNQCPCNFVKKRLKEVYPDDYLEDKIIGYIPEKFKQNRKIKIVKTDRTTLPLTNKGLEPKISWWLQCENNNFDYSEDLNAFVHNNSYYPNFTNTMHPKTVKAMVRQLRKMYLPKGLEFRLTGRYVGEEFKVKIK